MRDENFDGIDDYNAQQLANNINKDFFAALDRDEVLQKLAEESEDVFDNVYLDDDIATFNLGYQAGTLDERDRILKLIRDRVSKAKEYADNGQVTAMQRPVSWDDLYAISEAIIYGIKGEQK